MLHSSTLVHVVHTSMDMFTPRMLSAWTSLKSLEKKQNSLSWWRSFRFRRISSLPIVITKDILRSDRSSFGTIFVSFLLHRKSAAWGEIAGFYLDPKYLFKLAASVPSLRWRSAYQPWKDLAGSRKATTQTLSTQVKPFFFKYPTIASTQSQSSGSPTLISSTSHDCSISGSLSMWVAFATRCVVPLVFLTFARCCGGSFLSSPSHGSAFSQELEPTRKLFPFAVIIPSSRTSSSLTDTPGPSTPSSTSIEPGSFTWPTKCASLPLERISTTGALVPTTWIPAAMTSSSAKGSLW